jgi:hypothetical protein
LTSWNPRWTEIFQEDFGIRLRWLHTGEYGYRQKNGGYSKF